MIKNKKVPTHREEATEIICNVCGCSVAKNELGYFDDFVQIKKNWGYHSAYDGQSHEFDICQRCYGLLLEGLAVEPKIEE